MELSELLRRCLRQTVNAGLTALLFALVAESLFPLSVLPVFDLADMAFLLFILLMLSLTV